ncbi:MAG: TonB-dependent receptor [Parvularculaceae bacterium]
MKMLLLAGVSLAAVSSAASAQEGRNDPALQDVIVITGARPAGQATDVENLIDHPFEGADATSLLARIPGGARLGNGPLSGQAQYRGLFGPRLNVRVDGQNFATGGPNLMDPPFHYAPAPLISALEVDRGVSPVRNGPGLGGGANAVFKRVDFTDSDDIRLGYDVTAQGRSVDDSYGVGGVIGVSNNRFRFNVLGAYEEGDDAAFAGGHIAGTSFKRAVYGANAAVKTGAHEFVVDLRRQHTGPTGNAPFPMDIRYFDTDFIRTKYEGDFGVATINAEISYVDVDHAMNNFDMRPAPAAMMMRETYASAKTWGGKLSASVPYASGEFRIGGDVEQVDRAVEITNPMNPAFFIRNFNDISVERIGGFAEWSGGAGWLRSEIGVRVDAHDMRAGLASTGPAVPAGAIGLAGAFNATPRDIDDVTVDAVVRLWTRPAAGVSWRASLARKTRVPGYLERFGWLPTNASAGLADGNVYVGDQTLVPETAWIAEAGFDYAGARAYFRPTMFVRRIDNYIQGAPYDSTIGVIDTPVEMVSAMNGDPTPLVFANVDALLYGVDFDAGAKLIGNWRADLVGSFVRGERRDIDDYLYRIAPANLTAGLTYEGARWSATLEGKFVAGQSHVSATNSEAMTDGYGLMNFYADFELANGVRLAAGVENIFDKRYEDHLAGYNRIAGSDIAPGDRLPGVGRGVFVRINASR